jgi:hypothetical protein
MAFAITAPTRAVVRASRAGAAPAARCVARTASAVRRPLEKRVGLEVRFRSTSSTRCAATPGDDDAPSEDGLSSSFAEELKRRQAAEGSGSTPSSSAGDAGGDRWGEPGDAAPRFARDDGARGVETEQLKKSRALQNEGLEGFPTRAGELLKLGFTSFISFGPLIAVFSVLFVCTYLLMGSDFIHGGDEIASRPPPYVPPEALLAEPTVDKMVPLYDPVPYGQ